MRLKELPGHIRPLIEDLLDRGLPVWLVGSRANAANKASSDWDFIVFGDSNLVRELSAMSAPDKLDLLIVTDGDRFECPWPRESDGYYKRGELVKWQWSPTSPTTATYEGTKWPDDWGTTRVALLVER